MIQPNAYAQISKAYNELKAGKNFEDVAAAVFQRFNQ